MFDPQAITGHVEMSPKRVRVIFGGETVADSTSARLVWENPHYPQYYFPREDVSPGVLVPTDVTTEREGLGTAEMYTVSAGGREALGAAWNYPESPVEAIRGLIRFSWSAMDRWYEESEQVYDHPRSPYARIDVLESGRHVRVEVDGVTVADSHRPKLLFETGLPTRYYLHHDDVRFDLLEPSDSRTTCPYKGEAHYWNLRIGDTVHPDLVWSYPAPFAEVQKIAGLVCFYNEKVDIHVDGEPEVS